MKSTDEILLENGATMSLNLFTLALENVLQELKLKNTGINIDGIFRPYLRFLDDIANERRRTKTNDD